MKAVRLRRKDEGWRAPAWCRAAAVALWWCAPALVSVAGTAGDGNDGEKKAVRQRSGWDNPVESPVVAKGGRVAFALVAPGAQRVELGGQFMAGRRPMERDSLGVWRVEVDIPQADIYPYSFVVDGVEISDPSNPLTFPNERFKASLLVMPYEGALYLPAADVPAGQVRYCTYYSRRMGMFRPLLVYTPPGYDAGTADYPALYLVSGTTDTEETWFKVGRANHILDHLIARGRAAKMLVVMPYGYMPAHGTPDPSSGGAADMYADFAAELTDEIMPFVERGFRVRKERGSRAVAGFSRGGGQALFTAYSRPDLFSAVAAYAAYLTPEVMDARFAALFSDAGRADSLLRLKWFGVGDDDFLRPGVEEHLRYFDRKKVDYEIFRTGGGHTWMNARTYLTETLPLFFPNEE